MEIAVTGSIHIINFVLKQLKSIIPNNLLPVSIKQQTADFFVIYNIWVEKLHFWKPFKKSNKGTNVVSWINYKNLSRIVNLYLNQLFPERKELYLFNSLHEIVVGEFSIFLSVFV